MSLPVRLRRAAQTEYDAAADWYEARRRGLGRRFVTALGDIFATIGRQPDRFPEVWPEVREAALTGWPYCVYYQVNSDHVMVIAVFHTARDPSVWQSRA
jgi:plasmid stabilization system protein ParE